MTIQVKATERYFLLVMFIMLYAVALTFEFVDKILKCDHAPMKATEKYFPVVLFIMLDKLLLTFEFVDEILKCYPIQMEATAKLR